MSTITLRSVKGSALTFTEMDNNFDNINTDKLENVSEDTTPQLGGNLDVNGNAIVSASAGNIAITPDTTGSIVLDGLNWPQADGTTGQYLKTNGAGQLSWDDPDTDTDTTYTVSAVDSGDNAIIRLTGSDASTDDVVLVAGSNITLTPSGDNITIAATDTGIANVVEDTTPQLGGDLDLNSNDITGTGSVDITGNVIAQSALNAQTGTTYTTVLADASKLVTLSNASAITLTIPANSSVAYPVGTKIDFAQTGAGQVTVAGAGGVTVNATPGLKFRAQYSAATCIKTATDTWLLVGDLSA